MINIFLRFNNYCCNLLLSQTQYLSTDHYIQFKKVPLHIFELLYLINAWHGNVENIKQKSQ